MPKELDSESVNVAEMGQNEELIEKYGADNWYDWRYQNWGVKWNASDTEIYDEEHIIAFSTPWGPPIKFLKKLTEDFPGLRLELKHADECEGNGAGKVVFRYGRFDEEFTEDNEFYAEVWTY